MGSEALFTYTFSILHIVSAYWISESRNQWSVASLYCQTFCSSHLASFHSESDYLEAKSLIINSSYINLTAGFSGNHDQVWIGLNDISSEGNFQWSDGTSFKDYATDISGGVHPWASYEPINWNNEDCVHFSGPSRNYLWNDNDCDQLFRFMCNSCEGKLDKYILYHNMQLTAPNAEKWCQDHLGTALASVHSYDDNYAVQSLCDATDSENCWLGLTDAVNESIFKWTDNTTWDYATNISGGVYPWLSRPAIQPDNNDGGERENCIEIERPWFLGWELDWGWNDANCDKTNEMNHICNKPSDLCYQHQWTFIAGADNTYYDICAMNMNGFVIATISNKKWTANNIPLRIEYVFCIEDIIDSFGEVGIVMYGYNGNLCDSMFIGFQFHIDAQITIKRSIYQNGVSTNGVITNNNSSLNNNMHHYYRFDMTCVDMNGTHLECYTYLDGINATTFILNMHDKYIGIFNKGAKISAKSIFISGTPTFEDAHVNLEQCPESQSPSASPTTEPTIYPTLEPTTTKPTYNPSMDPTKEPTLEPTATPSIYPTEYPTFRAPTIFPSYEPSASPSAEIIIDIDITKPPSSIIGTSDIILTSTNNSQIGARANVKEQNSFPWIIIIIILAMLVIYLFICIYYRKKKKRKFTKAEQILESIQLQMTTTATTQGKVQISESLEIRDNGKGETGNDHSVEELYDNPEELYSDPTDGNEGNTVGNTAHDTADNENGETITNDLYEDSSSEIDHNATTNERSPTTTIK